MLVQLNKMISSSSVPVIITEMWLTSARAPLPPLWTKRSESRWIKTLTAALGCSVDKGASSRCNGQAMCFPILCLYVSKMEFYYGVPWSNIGKLKESHVHLFPSVPCIRKDVVDQTWEFWALLKGPLCALSNGPQKEPKPLKVQWRET